MVKQMNKSILKTLLREIKKSAGRFISIMCIIALGVGFYSGLKVARADMLKTGNDFYSQLEFYDYRLLCSYGYDDDSVLAARNNENVKYAEGAYSADAVMLFDGEEHVYKLHSVTDNVNKLNITAGRMPTAENECIVDAKYFSESDIGKKFKLSKDNEKDTLKMLNAEEYTIVGIAGSPIYLNHERGTTSLQGGRVSAFLYLPKCSFDSDYYTELYINLKENYYIYSDEYDDYIDSVEDSIKSLSTALGDERYNSIKSEAKDEYDENYEKYEDNLKKYNDEKADAYDKLNDAENELDESERTLNEKTIEYENGVKEYEKNLAEFNSGKAELESAKQQLESGMKNIASGLAQLNAAIAQYEAAPVLDTQSDLALQGLKAQRDELNNKKSALTAQQQQLYEKELQLKSAENELKTAKQQLDDAKIQLDDGKRQLADGRAEYNDSKKTADDEFSDAENELADAKQKLSDAKKDIDDIEKPDCYTLGRNTNTGYVCFENDSSIVDGLAEVFPLFFFLVAALMCMTTMTRMVEEQRTEIGVLKALGYSGGVIMSKYLSYSGFAALIGASIGFFGGSYVFPKVIWGAYTILYGFAPLKIIYNPIIGIAMLLAAMICTVGAAVPAIYGVLRENAAQIMRPKAPKGGKHAFYERFTLFKKLGFLQKVSVRNITRYKGRFIMMVLGVAGCTALLITGFGIRDSIQKICDYQYGNIMQYDYELTFKDSVDEQNRQQFVDDTSYAGNALFLHDMYYDVTTPAGVKSAKVVAPVGDSVKDYIHLYNADGDVQYPKDGYAVVSEKFASSNNIKIGSEITVTNSDMKETRLKVSGICKNYVYNYVYTTLSSLSDGFGSPVEIKSAYILSNTDDFDGHKIAAKLMKEDNVSSVTVVADLIDRVSNMLKSLDLIIVVIIICAGALAFVVIYNLTNINITERMREIATIKVLGFYPSETAMYVFGEFFVLTAFGALFGILLGRLLHAYVMAQINIDMVSFDVIVSPMSILFSILLTFVFALLVDVFMHFKLQKIDMAQSLKSIE